MGGRADLPRQVRQQPPLGGREPFARAAVRYPQPAHVLTAEGERNLVQGRAAGLFPPELDELKAILRPPLDDHVRHPQRPAHVGGNRRQRGPPRNGRGQLLGHPAQRRVRVVTVAVQQPVHQALQPDSQRIHHDGDHDGAGHCRGVADWAEKIAASRATAAR